MSEDIKKITLKNLKMYKKFVLNIKKITIKLGQIQVQKTTDFKPT